MPISRKNAASPSLENALGKLRPGEGKPPIEDHAGNGGELHQDIPGKADHGDGAAHLTDNFGHRISEIRTACVPESADRRCSKILSCAKRYSISTMNAFPNVSSMSAAIGRAHV